MPLVAGIDLGTQSLKAVILDAETGDIKGEASRPIPMVEGLPPGHSEQDPAEWVAALRGAMPEAIGRAGCSGEDVAALAVSGQQHGFVPLDQDDRVIRPAKLWNDMSTADQAARIVERVGGADAYRAITGNALPPGFTASKILWLMEQEPERFARLHTVLLPHDYLNWYLTGRRAMEAGDASGTGLFELRKRAFSPTIVNAIHIELGEKLPELVLPGALIGTVREDIAGELGLSSRTQVAAGGGDNMMGAIGTGNVVEGRLTVSLGTSGTVFAYSATPIVDPRGEVAAFCDSTGGYLPLGCTQNVTVATEAVRDLLGLSLAELETAAAQVPPGCNGLVFLPFLTGERTPDLPAGKGVFYGLDHTNMTPGHLARAAMEGATFGLFHLCDRLRELGVLAHQVRLTGGGANSATWRQIVADVFGYETCMPVPAQGAAL